MLKQSSPFAALTGAEKQIKWLEYQSIRLPYIPCEATTPVVAQEDNCVAKTVKPTDENQMTERPQPPPEIPRFVPDTKTRHSQYDAVIARMKQAELQARRYQTSSQTTEKIY